MKIPSAFRLCKFVVLVGAACALAACGGGGPSGSGAVVAGAPPVVSNVANSLSAQAELGRQIFADPTLSASGRMSCASCHDPANEFAQANSAPVQSGGAGLDVPGFRAVPSLKYLSFTPAFYFQADGTPTGGFNRDGRVNTFKDQAQRPFLAAHEMANGTAAVVAAKLAQAPYAAEFRRVFGSDVFADSDQVFDRMRFALERYQKEDPDFAPFSSKYDAVLAGRASLSAQEIRGLALFNSPLKGNCAACHPSSRGTDGSPPMFTDFTYDDLGVPRNTAIAANADPAYFDLGLCGPERVDLSGHADLCGAFKVPTLRNVATRKVFFHNGQFDTLQKAIEFYVQRDTNPQKWYPTTPGGSIDSFNDAPVAARVNVNRLEVPYNRNVGDEPALNAQEITDLIAFLNTLTDGYTP